MFYHQQMAQHLQQRQAMAQRPQLAPHAAVLQSTSAAPFGAMPPMGMQVGMGMPPLQLSPGATLSMPMMPPPLGMQFARPVAPLALQPPAVPPAVSDERKRPLDSADASQSLPAAKHVYHGPRPGIIPQRDGPADDEATPPAASEAPSTGPVSGGAAAGAAAAAGERGGGKGLDEELGEDDDLADVDAEEVDEEAVANVLRGQFDKVQRSKGKWKISAKNCVATIDGRDYLLKKVTGEMHFH